LASVGFAARGATNVVKVLDLCFVGRGCCFDVRSLFDDPLFWCSCLSRSQYRAKAAAGLGPPARVTSAAKASTKDRCPFRCRNMIMTIQPRSPSFNAPPVSIPSAPTSPELRSGRCSERKLQVSGSSNRRPDAVATGSERPGFRVWLAQSCRRSVRYRLGRPSSASAIAAAPYSRLTQPLIVKNARFTRERSVGLTTACSAASRIAVTPTADA